MKRPIKIMSRLLDAVQRRFRRARPGSILIMVVSLLVLLALIGTAAISTARLDRVSSGQNVQNTQVDLLAEGLKQMVISQLVSDLYDVKDNTSSDSLKDFFNSTDSAASDPALGNKATRDAIIGSRVPERLIFANTNTFNQNSATPIWRSLSYPPFLNGHPNGANFNSKFRFDPPNLDSSDDFVYSLPLPKLAYVPLSIPLQGEIFPALQQIYDTGAPGNTYLAADTDGDGIADALLFRLPISPIRGVTYYGAIRVVDNSAAVNINTARNPIDEHQVVTLAQGGTHDLSIAGMYPASVNVDRWLTTPETVFRDNQLYLGIANPATPGAWNKKAIGDTASAANPNVYDQMDPRSDTFFLTPGDALFHQLARRLDNPGFYDNNGNRYGGGVRPFGVGGSMSLAYGFTLVNASAHDSLIESVFHTSLVSPLAAPNDQVAWRPYRANQSGAWFADNFDYASSPSADARLRRALITTFNPVRNDVLRHSLDTATNVQNPSKTNINTAKYDELKASFQDVMADGPLTTPFDDDAAANVTDAYMGMKFNSTNYEANPPLERHPAEMFRSPLRPSGPSVPNQPRLAPYEVMQLRAAIAATNVLAMRNPTDMVKRNVQLLQPLPSTAANAPAVTQQYAAVIYGMKRQPFITEVFVNNNPEIQVPNPTLPPPPGGPGQNQSGFAAIELHNPYDTELNLWGYSLKLINRDSFIGKPMPYLEIDGTAGGTSFTFAKTDIIPPHGYIVVWNYKLGVVDNDTAQYLPGDVKDPNLPALPVPINVVYCPKLHNMIGKELVLLRPMVLPIDPPLANPDPVLDWAPVDSFDCSGLPHQTFTSGAQPLPAKAWHYVRANDPLASSAQFAGRAWHFVYPGRYDGSQSERRHQGTEAETWDPTTPDPWAITGPTNAKSAFGLPDKNNSREGAVFDNLIASFPIQIGNSSMDSQFTAAGNPGMAFPIHGFARAGDIMQVPFIGSYVIIQVPVPQTNAYSFIEANAVTMDAAFAEDTDTTDDLTTVDLPRNMPEDIGRFAPPLFYAPTVPPATAGPWSHVTGTMDGYSGNGFTDSVRNENPNYWNNCNVIVYNTDQSATATWRRQFRHVQQSNGTSITLDNAFSPPLTGTHYTYKIQAIGYSHYGWASDLLDYFTTINAPGEDFLPNVDPDPALHTPLPDPVKNDSDPARNINRTGLAANPQTTTEATLPSEGLININTAGWKVLATLPLVMAAGNTVDVGKTEDLAKAIVYFRDVDDGFGTRPGAAHPHGPFKSLMELCMVPNFASAGGTIDLITSPPALASNPGIDQGDFSPMTQNPGGDLVRFDFKEKYLTLTRISNLVTLRSDCYTVYLQVQGWSDAGSANAKLMVQRRLAFIVDRSRVTPLKPTPSVYNVQVPPSGR
jgi:hypothetical protein